MPDIATQHTAGSYLMPSLPHATVADAMHPGIIACPPDAGLTDVARLMASHHVHCVVVMATTNDDEGERSVWGLISDLDVLRAGIHLGPDSCARALALEPIVSVVPATPLRAAGELMLRHGVGHLVVVDPETKRPTGVLSTLDIAGVLAWGEA